jgi:tetratricopeptide (TPR) repeat protein
VPTGRGLTLTTGGLMGLVEGSPDSGPEPAADAAGRLVLQGNDLVARGDLDGAIAAYTEAIRLDPRSTTAYLGRGVARSRTGQFAEAIADATEAIRLDPRHAPAYRNRGETMRPPEPGRSPSLTLPRRSASRPTTPGPTATGRLY